MKKIKSIQEKQKIYSNKKILKTKQKIYVLIKYGRSCINCKIDELAVLSIDHINDDGYKLKKYEREKLYWDLRKELEAGKKRFDLQVLCMNCQYRKRMYGKDFNTWVGQIKSLSKISIPKYHPGKPRTNFLLNHEQKRKAYVMHHYGSKCAYCEIDELAALSIDHINDDGKNDKSLYKKLRKELKNGKKRHDLQVLCMSCQFRKREYGNNFNTWKDKAVLLSTNPIPVFKKRGRQVGLRLKNGIWSCK